MTNLEDRIIAYLDGTLDETSRAELLHTLSVSPDKRKLLEEHIKLREIISLGHKPASVPLNIERKLADRIPILMQELPYLAERSHRIAPIIGVRSTSYFTMLGTSISGFFASRFGPAISLASLALVGGLSWYALTLNPSAENPVPGAPTAETQSTQSPLSDKSEVTTENGSTTTSTATPEVSTVSPRADVNQSVLNGSKPDASLSQRTTDRASRASKQNGVSSVDRSNVANASVAERNSASSTDQTNDASSANGSSAKHEKSLIDENNVAQEQANETERVADQPKPVQPSMPEPSRNAIKDPAQDAPPLPLPSQTKTVTGRFSAQLDFSTGMSVRPNQKSQQYETSAGKSFPILGLGYEINPHLSIGVEAGASVLSQQREEVQTFTHQGSAPAGSLISVNRTIEYTTGIVDVNAYWSQATVRYTLNPEDRFKYELTGGAGAAFVGGVAPMVSAGIGGTYDISEAFAITLGVSGRAAWLSGAAAESDQSSAPLAGETVAIVSHRSSTEQVFSSSIAGRLGIRFGF